MSSADRQSYPRMLDPAGCNRPLIREYESFPDNVVDMRRCTVGSSTRSWIPSPKSTPFPLPEQIEEPPAQSSPPIVPKTEKWEDQTQLPQLLTPRSPSRKHTRIKNKGLRKSWYNPNRWIDRIKVKKRKLQPVAENWIQSERRQATIQEWRAEGYWARPTIDGVMVDNLTPSIIPRDYPPTTEEIEYAIANVGTNPDVWIPGIYHESLPERPLLWRELPLQITGRLPAGIQLNPMLEHRPLGQSPIEFDMRLEKIDGVLIGYSPPIPDDPNPLPLYMIPNGPNGLQPATYPGVNFLPVTIIADETSPRFPWPFAVVSATHASLHITIRDVLIACITNFHQRMSMQEVESLSAVRREHLYQTYYSRLKAAGIRDSDSGIERIDYLGDRHYFRGFEVAPNGTLIMFVGPPS
ncbi:hypothetical protein ABKN59_009485 [Abortiporus biennis]